MATLWWGAARVEGGRAPASLLSLRSPRTAASEVVSDAPGSLASRPQATRALGLTSKHPTTNRCGKALFYFRLKEFSPLVSCSVSLAERETGIFRAKAPRVPWCSRLPMPQD